MTAAMESPKSLIPHRGRDGPIPKALYHDNTFTGQSPDVEPLRISSRSKPQRRAQPLAAAAAAASRVAARANEEIAIPSATEALAPPNDRSLRIAHRKREWEADLEHEYEEMKGKMDRELMYDADLDGIWDEETAYDWPHNHEYSQYLFTDMLMNHALWEGGVGTLTLGG